MLASDYHKLMECLCCGSKELMKYANLGMQPPPNRFVKPDFSQITYGKKIEKFPLQVNVCRECFHSQVEYAVNPDILFKDYPYRTGVSDTLVDHYAKFAASMLNIVKDRKEIRVLDIGCNDGTLMQLFDKIGCGKVWTYGIDPCPVGDYCASKQTDIHKGYFAGAGFASKNVPGIHSFDIITATNVLAHNANPRRFLETCAANLSTSGILCLEFPYGESLLDHCEFDTMYHEHYSYFLATSLAALLKNTDLVVLSVGRYDIHGGSLRLVLGISDPLSFTDHCDGFYELIAQERYHWLQDIATYGDFQKRIDDRCHDLKETILHFYKQDYSISIFGASAKATVLLNYLSLPIHHIFDETPAKIGKVMPGLDILVQHPREIDIYYQRQCYLIMAWNCYDECLTKIRHYSGSDDKVRKVAVTHIPEIKMEDL